MAVAPDAIEPRYPVRVTMEYPERVSRLSTAFRIILAIPVLVFLALVGGANFDFNTWNGEGTRTGGAFAGGIAGGVIVAIWATILVRGSIPRWLFDFQVGLNRFTARAYAYVALLTDKYPAFEGDWALNYEVAYPDRLSRWKLVFWKIITAIPHFFVLAFLAIAAFVVVVIGWFAILFTGAFPRGLHAFVVGVLRWGARVEAYVQSLTDEFPPYSLEDDAGPGSEGSLIISAIIGGVVVAAAIAGAVALVIFLFVYFNDSKSREVDLSELLSGTASAGAITLDGDEFRLVGAADPADTADIGARPGSHLVEFTVTFTPDDEPGFSFEGVADDDVERDTLRLKTGEGTLDPVLLTFERIPAPLDVSASASGELRAFFEVEDGADIEDLRGYTGEGNRHVTWKFD